jgi:probable F420-dependent oxidoreductase
MKLGVAIESVRPAREAGELGERVERLGFDSLWTPDHVAFSQPILDPFATLAIYAARTTHLALGTAVFLLPLRHPVHVAKQAASLDWSCGGRLVLGVGVGGEFPAEFAACEVPLAERGARADEALGTLRALWRGEPPPPGRFHRVPATALAPRSPRAGGPPIWVGGRAESALRRAAFLGDGYLGYFLDARGLATRAKQLAELRAGAPDPACRTRPLALAIHCFVRIEATREAALGRAQLRLGTLYGDGANGAAQRFALLGTLEDCRAQLAALAAAGAEHVIVSPIAESEADLAEQLSAAAELRAS